MHRCHLSLLHLPYHLLHLQYHFLHLQNCHPPIQTLVLQKKTKKIRKIENTNITTIVVVITIVTVTVIENIDIMAVTVIANIDTVLQIVRDVMMEIQNIDTERAAVIDEIETITMLNVQGITKVGKCSKKNKLIKISFKQNNIYYVYIFLLRSVCSDHQCNVLHRKTIWRYKRQYF